MSLPIHCEQLERNYVKSAELLIRAFEDLNINSKITIKEYMVRLLDDAFAAAEKLMKGNPKNKDYDSSQDGCTIKKGGLLR